MALKYRFNLKDIKLEDFKVYLVAMFKGILPKKKIRILMILKNLFSKNLLGYLKLLYITI